MSNSLSFAFEGNAIRVISDDIFNPLFAAYDVAKALGYKKPENAVARHCKRQSTTPKQGGGYITVIPESDLYRLTLRSKLESAERFQDWVVEEVLPAIRKTGGYQDEQQPRLSSKESRKPLRDAVNLLASRTGLHWKQCWNIVHQYIGTKAEDMTDEQVKEAIHYIHLVLLNSAAHLSTLPEPDKGLTIPSDGYHRYIVCTVNGEVQYQQEVGNHIFADLDEVRQLMRDMKTLSEAQEEMSRRMRILFGEYSTEKFAIPLSV